MPRRAPAKPAMQTLPITERDIPIDRRLVHALACFRSPGPVLRNQADSARNDNARDRRRLLCLSHELLCFGGLRLHGGPHRFIQQPTLGYWHFGCDRRGAVACGRRATVCRAGRDQGAHGLRAFHHCGDFQRRRLRINLQDLKTGPSGTRLRGSSRLRHHRVLAGAVVIPPVLTGQSGVGFAARRRRFASESFAAPAGRRIRRSRRRHRRGPRLELVRWAPHRVAITCLSTSCQTTNTWRGLRLAVGPALSSDRGPLMIVVGTSLVMFSIAAIARESGRN